MFECLGGFQCRQHLLRIREEGKPEADRTPEEWDFGFARTDNFVGSPRKLPGRNLPSTNGLHPSATLLRMVSSHKSMKYGLSHCMTWTSAFFVPWNLSSLHCWKRPWASWCGKNSGGADTRYGHFPLLDPQGQERRRDRTFISASLRVRLFSRASRLPDAPRHI